MSGTGSASSNEEFPSGLDGNTMGEPEHNGSSGTNSADSHLEGSVGSTAAAVSSAVSTITSSNIVVRNIPRSESRNSDGMFSRP